MALIQEYIWIVWDLAAVCILAYFVRNCAYRGLASTVMHFSGYIIAAFVAKVLSTPSAEWLYNNIVRDALRISFTKRLDEALTAGGATSEEILSLLPSVFAKMAEKSGHQVLASATKDVGGVVETLLDAILRDPLLSLLQGITFLVIFSLSLMLVRRIARAFSGLYHVPVVGTLNMVLGGVVGVLQGVLLLCICAFVLRAVLNVSGEGWWWLNPQLMDQTYIWRVMVCPI